MADRLAVKSGATLRLVGTRGDVKLFGGSVLKLVSGGPMGLQGPEGGVGQISYRHTQTLPLFVWLVTHNFGYEPAGIDPFEEVAPGVFERTEGIIHHINSNAFTIQYDVAIAGYVNVS